YAGSGLVIQVLARFQPTPSRIRAWRIDSSLISLSVIRSAKATSAASASVQVEVGLPKSRGLRWSRARSRSAARPPRAGLTETGRWDFGRRQAVPSAWKAAMALRTVPVEHRRAAAIGEGRRPSALAERIWDRRSVKASGERRPARRASRSGSVRGRTKVG